MSTAYTYKSLRTSPQGPAIRILSLDPASDLEAPLSADLEPITLSQCNDAFEALSYTWGDATPVDSVAINGARIQIGKNLSQALRRLRFHDEARRLWIDAVCINQMNLAEKTTQVPLMDRIYSIARRTVVWLGETGSWTLDKVIKAKQEAPASKDEPLVFDPQKGPLDLPWFSRRWIIQEIALTKDVLVMYAGLEMEWKQFLKASDKKWRTYSPQDEFRDKHSLAVLRMREQTERSDSTLELLERLSYAKCSVPHDYIAGLSAIQTKDVNKQIPFRVDYQLSVEQVYLDFAIQAVGKGFGLSVLWIAAKRLKNYLRYEQPDERDALPSWVPDWRWPTPDHQSQHECDVFHGYPARVVNDTQLEIACRLTHRLDEDWPVENMPWNGYNDLSTVSPRKGDVRAEFETPDGSVQENCVIVLRPIEGQEAEDQYAMVIAWRLGGFSWGEQPPMTLLECESRTIRLV